MAISNLTGQKTSKTFQNLMQISSSGEVFDGLGNLVTFLQLTSSFASGSAGSGGTGAGFPYTGSALITGSLGLTGSLGVIGSLTQGSSSLASGIGSHAEGQNTLASGDYSHAEGLGTAASGLYQHVQGQYNVSSSAQSAFIVGNGTADNARSNLIFASGSQVQITGSVIATQGFTGSLFGTASYAPNGGVTSLIAGSGISLSPAIGKGDVTISSLSAVYNTMTGSYGSFYDTGSVLATSATTIYSMSLNVTDISNGVFISASAGDTSRIKFTNAGVYDVQFSAQFSNSDNANQDTVVWIRKNGTDISDSAGTVGIPPFKAGSNGQALASWNYFLNVSANDYIQMCWNVEEANVITLETIPAGTSPTHPRTPSLILTANRVDTFLSNTGSFSGTFTGQFTGSLFGTSSWATNSISSSYPLAVTGSSLISTYVTGGSGGNTTGSIFIGNNAGQNASRANNSNFLGDNAGHTATSASNSNFLGKNTGLGATNASSANFFGTQAGQGATNASSANFFGNQVGLNATNAYQSNFLGNTAGYQATNAYQSNFLGNLAGRDATSASNSNFLGNGAGYQATDASYSNFLGSSAGSTAASASNSNFFGNQAGLLATNANNSNFLGNSAGLSAASASFSNFLGYQAGFSATNANNSNFLGASAGQNATNANNSNFFGVATGYQTNASYSNFFGQSAGYQATNASNSNFLGQLAGYAAISASNSTLLGVYAGADLNGNSSIGSNNIIIGTRITLASQRKDSINLGGIIFATGSYSGGIMYSGSQAGIGRVGINVVNPTYTLEVGGTVAFPNINNAGHPDVLYRSNTGEITYGAAPAPPATTQATVYQINRPDATNVFIRPQELEQSKYTTINIYNNLNFI